MSKSKLTIGQKILYYIFLILLYSIAIWPDFVLMWVFRPLVYVLVYRVARYRVKVVRDNLEKCFPEKSPKELRSIERKFYLFFSECILNVVNMLTMSRRKLKRNLSVADCENLDVDPRHVIIMTAHFGCWEMLAGFPMRERGYRNVCVYHELQNPVADEIMRYLRERVGGIPVERREVLRHYVANRKGYSDGCNMMWGMISDQTPARDVKHHWIRFMGRPTVFARGSEFMAVKFGMPIYFLWIERRGFCKYHYKLEMIYDGTEQLPEHEITERYAALLEQQIRQQPELWLWTHRRWKRHFGAEAQQSYYERYPEERQ